MIYIKGLVIGFGFSLVGLTTVRANIESTEARKPILSVSTTDTVPEQANKFSLRPMESKPDSLLMIRTFFATKIMQRGTQLTSQLIKEQLAATPKSLTLYRQRQLLKPIGPVIALTGLVAGYFSIKGKGRK